MSTLLIAPLLVTAAALILFPLAVAGSNAMTSRNIASEGAWFGFKEIYWPAVLWTVGLLAILWAVYGGALWAIDFFNIDLRGILRGLAKAI